MTRCVACRHWRPWADGESGECLFKFPPFIHQPVGFVDVKTRSHDGCDLGTPKDKT